MTELLLVDVSAIFWANWHATVDQPIGTAFEQTVGKVQRLASHHERVAICTDSPPYFRKDIFPAYKAHRDKPEPSSIEQFSRTKERLAADGYPIWGVRGYEADDIIAGAVAWALARDSGERVVICSADKDLLQLVGPRCSVLSTRTGETVDVAATEAKWGVGPERMGDLLALTGDKSDGIPGVPGVGPKKAAALLLEFGSLDGVLAALDTDPGMVTPDGLRRALEANRAQLELSRILVTLRTDASIDYEAIFAPRVAMPLNGATAAEWEDVDERDDMGDDQEEPTMSTEQETKAEQPAAPPPPTERHDEEPSSPGNGAPVTALARVESASFELALEPTSLGAAFKLATGIFNSRLYPRYTNPEGIWAVIIRGREMGLGAMTALDVMHFFEGKVSMHAHLIIARAKAHPDCEYLQCVESTADSCTYETKNRRNPKPTRHTYTIAQAKQAGLCPEAIRTASTAGKGEKDSRGMWEKRPAEQLRKTCGVQITRIEFPEAAMGLYAPEELGANE